MDVVNLKIKDLKPYEKNPRKNDGAVEYVANSIKEFGFKVPIVVDVDNVIVAGHTRYKAAKKLGLKEVPAIVASDLTNEQIKAFRLADNKVAEQTEWDYALLADELDEILGIDMEDFGFSFSEEDVEVVEDAPVIEPKKDPVTKLGDMWKMGGGIFYCAEIAPISLTWKGLWAEKKLTWYSQIRLTGTSTKVIEEERNLRY